MKHQKISEGRQTLFYGGQILALLGLLTFASVFVSAALNFGNFVNFEAQGQSIMFRAFGGMAMITLGGVLAKIGRMGLAGSGVVLDPQRARNDVEPWTRMAGGMLHDALDESGIELGKHGSRSNPSTDFADKLRQLHALREEGILSEEEYQREKAEILANN